MVEWFDMPKINVNDTVVSIIIKNEEDYISLTDIARYKNPEESRFVIQNWMKTNATVEFLGLWELINNPYFNRVDFDAVKSQAGSNSFVLTPKKWITTTDAIGITSKSGRYNGGTFAHKDIAFEFASWISAEFKLYLIKEFQRLKAKESERKGLDWNAKRFLAKANYRVHTDAVKEHLIPKNISQEQVRFVYADEGDILNVALFGVTAKQWRDSDESREGNIRDYADIAQLVCLAGLESLNAEFINQNLEQSKRMKKLNEIAIRQMKSLMREYSPKQLKE